MTAVTEVVRGESNQLPNGWHQVRLGDIGEIVSGFTLGRKLRDRRTRRVPYLRVANVKDGQLNLSDVYEIEATEDEINRYRLRYGDLLLTEGGDADKLGRGTFWEEQIPNCIHQNHIFRVRFDLRRFSPAFISAQLRSPQGKAYFLRHANQTTGIATINQRVLANCPLAVPPLLEQHRIAAILSEQLSVAEQARAAAEAQLSAAKTLPAACLLVAFDGAVVRRWPVKRLGDVLRLRKEVIHPRDDPVGDATFVGLEHIEPLTGVRTGSVPIEMSRLTGRKPRFCKGDIVYGYLRPYLNKVWIAEFDGLCSVDQYVYSVASDAADTEFVAWFMRSPVYLKRAPISASPGQLPRIRTDEVTSVKIGLPSLSEQRQVVATLRRQMGETERASQGLRVQLDAINRLPAALLRRAFNGAI